MGANASPATEHRHRPLLPEPAPVGALTRPAAYPWLVVCVACVGAFAGQVDASIVQLGLPTLEQTFDTPLSEVSWVAVAYSLSLAAVLPIYARLAEIAAVMLLIAAYAVIAAVASSLRSRSATSSPPVRM